jgi:hypothetical protein
MIHRLPNGREIYLVRWAMEGTYSGFLPQLDWEHVAEDYDINF